MTGIFNATIFNNQVFNVGTGAPSPPPAETPAKTGTGGIDPHRAYKPTGLISRKKLTLKKPVLEERIEEFNEAQTEIAAKLSREFIELKPISQMSMLDIEREIGIRLHRISSRNEEEELMVLLLMAAAAGHN